MGVDTAGISKRHVGLRLLSRSPCSSAALPLRPSSPRPSRRPLQGRSAAAAAPSAGRRAAVQLFALDQALRQGESGWRQGSLPDRQGGAPRRRRVHRQRGADRAGRRAEENPAHHGAARHAACGRHAHADRPRASVRRAVRRLLPERLHGRLRGECGLRRHSSRPARRCGCRPSILAASRPAIRCRSRSSPRRTKVRRSDPKVLEAQQQKLEQELQRKAEEVRSKLQPAAPAR